jgi:hypothetical protein
MIYSTKCFVRILDYYYDEPPECAAADIVRYNHWTTLPPGRVFESHTILLDLTQGPEQILAGMDKGLRYELRRAEGGGFTTLHHDAPDAATLHSFCEFYDAFAKRKGLPPISRRRLNVLAGSRNLRLSAVTRDGATLVWHAYTRFPPRIRLLHSASVNRPNNSPAERQQIGRANRFLHWDDIQTFRGAGMTVLDLGGWYAGSDGTERLGINAFKEEFGGTIVKQFNSIDAASPLGRAALWARSHA